MSISLKFQRNSQTSEVPRQLSNFVPAVAVKHFVKPPPDPTRNSAPNPKGEIQIRGLHINKHHHHQDQTPSRQSRMHFQASSPRVFMRLLHLSFVVTALLLLGVTVTQVQPSPHPEESPFECGFESFSLSRRGFRIKFFMLVVLFVLFDVELALVLPLPLVQFAGSPTIWGCTFTIVLALLFGGLVKEWSALSLK